MVRHASPKGGPRAGRAGVEESHDEQEGGTQCRVAGGPKGAPPVVEGRRELFNNVNKQER